MGHARRAGSALAAGVAVALLVAACGGSSSPNGSSSGGSSGGASGSSSGGASNGGTASASSSADKGGTITAYIESDFEHLDPVRSYTENSLMFGQLLERTLYAYRYDHSLGKSVLVPDLAKSSSHNANFTQWTFTLKPNQKYEDGSTITAADIKYNVERSFAPELEGGAPYGIDYVKCQAKYAGPYGGQGCTGITTPNANTIVFTLNQPVTEFSSATTTPTYSPVPKAKDTRGKYDSHVFSSGPYKIDTYNRNRELVLVRNTNWNQADDPVRTALPDKWDIRFGQNPTTVSKQLIQDNTADKASINTAGVESGDLSSLNRPNVKNRVIQGTDNCRSFLIFNYLNKTIGNDKNLRIAMMYGVDKQAWQLANGGTSLVGTTNTIIPKNVVGYSADQPYTTKDTGDEAMARSYLAKSNYKGETLSIGVSDSSPSRVAGIVSVQASLKKIGINLSVNKIPGDTYYSTEQNPKAEDDIATGSWCYDWPSMASIVPINLGHDYGSTETTAHNETHYTDPKGFAMMDAAAKIGDPTKAAAAWASAYKYAMQDAPILPLGYSKDIYVSGSKIVNNYINPDLGGLIDVCQVGVKQ